MGLVGGVEQPQAAQGVELRAGRGGRDAQLIADRGQLAATELGKEEEDPLAVVTQLGRTLRGGVCVTQLGQLGSDQAGADVSAGAGEL